MSGTDFICLAKSKMKELKVVVFAPITPKCAITPIRISHKSIEIEGFIRESCCAIVIKK